jgi:SAM-dependent methyltransferase
MKSDRASVTAPRLLARNRARLERDLTGSPRRAWTSPVTLGLDRALTRALAAHARGTFLDAGCGTMPYRARVTPAVSVYIGFDIERRAPDVALLGDVQNMSTIRDASADVVLCSEVLEHVPRPAAALAEFQRILRPGGTLILSTPFLARLHEEPHDYYRYTSHGLRDLLCRAGFTVNSVEAIGGLFAFLGHQPSMVICSLIWPVPIVRDVVVAVVAASITIPCRILDRLTGNAARFPAGYVTVAER